MPTLRQRLLTWFLTRFLHFARGQLARDPTPENVRRHMARFDRLFARQGGYALGPPVALGACTAQWLDAGGTDSGPVVLYLHGGAFIGESPHAHQAMLSRLCRRAGARGFYVDYRLAPEHRYPAATDDCLAAYRHLLGQGIDPGRVVIAGDSSGGNLAVVTAMRARDEGLPLAAALLLLSPVLDGGFSGDSIRRNDGLDPLFRASVLERLALFYADEDQRRLPYVSPLDGDLAGLPPALALVGSSELLLDDSVRFASRAGNAVLQVWHGMPHVFPLMHVLPESDRALELMAAFVTRHAVAAAASPALGGQGGC